MHQLPFFFFFFLKWFKSFSRVSHESGTEVNQMDPVSTGLIPGLPFRQDSLTVSEGPGLAVALSLCPSGTFYMDLATGEAE